MIVYLASANYTYRLEVNKIKPTFTHNSLSSCFTATLDKKKKVHNLQEAQNTFRKLKRDGVKKLKRDGVSASTNFTRFF